MTYSYQPRDRVPGCDHFKIYEIGKSRTATRHGIDNRPDDEAVARASLVGQHVLEPVRAHFGRPFSPNSWLRREPLEKAICWVDNPERGFLKWCNKHGYHPNTPEHWTAYFKRKSHPLGEAVDIEIPGVPNTTLYNWIRDNLTYDKLIAEFMDRSDPTAGWVHVSFTNRHPNRGQTLSDG